MSGRPDPLVRPTVEVIEDAERFAALREEWTELLQSSASNCLFLTWEWLYTWWKHLGGGKRLSLLAVRSGDRLIALAPLALSRSRIPALSPLRRLEFLGTGSIGSDYLDVVVRGGWESEALEALAEHLQAETPMLVLSQVRGEGSFARELAGDLLRKGWHLSSVKTNVCPYITLCARSWPSYLAELGREHRYNFLRRIKHLMRDFEVSFEPARTEEERRQALSLLVALHHRRWSQRGGSDALHRPELVSFHEELSRLALERGWLRLYVLRLDGAPAAALYGFVYQRVFYFYQSGFDPLYGKHSVGLVAMGLAIRNAVAEGVSEYDLLHGSEEYKYRWARQTRDLVRLEVYPSLARVALYRRGRELGRKAGRIVRLLDPAPAAGTLWRGLYGMLRGD
jgi:CelD/BcsL family acetyltransferase involved in cellulose biosynthesis